MRGEYQDTVFDADGRVIIQLPWHSNTIVESAWSLLAGLLSNRANFDGIVFCAYGTGDTAWDDLPGGVPTASPTSAQLQQEVQRVRVIPESISYLNANGQPTSQPTSRIGITSLLRWRGSSPVTLREFGLVGGNASEATNTGLLINYVTHTAMTLQPGALLQRTVRLAFGNAALPASDPIEPPPTPPPPPPPEEWDPFNLLEVPDIGIGRLSVTAIRELGDVARAFEQVRIETLNDFLSQPDILNELEAEPARVNDARTRALAVIQSAATFQRASETIEWNDLLEMSIDDVLNTTPKELADSVGVDFEVALLAQTILGPLRLSLLVRDLRRIRVEQLLER